MQRLLVPCFFYFSLFLLTACHTRTISRTKTKIRLGEQKIIFISSQSGQGGPLFYNVHDDENTSVKAVQHYFKKHSGRLIELKNGGKRLISFTIDDTRYRIDPNRIYTVAGAKKSLEDNGPFSQKAHDAVNQFAYKVLQLLALESGKPIITLHNNSDNQYSLISYLPDCSEAGNAAQLYFNEGMDPDDFFFVTDPRIFMALKNLNLNAALQDNRRASDDGSLSIYAGQHNIPYVNVEAQHGHLQEQEIMINQVVNVLNE